jgi:hypothetical protein
VKNDSGFNREFFYLFADDVELFNKVYRINDLWKNIYLNKTALVSVREDDEDDAFIDIHAEHSLTHQDGFRVFKKRGL